MLYRGFAESVQTGAARYVSSWETVGPLLESMEDHRLTGVWGLHDVPFLQGTNALGETALFPMFGSSNQPKRLAVLSAHTSAGFPGEVNICLAVADNDSKTGRPLLVPLDTQPDFSSVTNDARGYSTLLWCVGAPDQSAWCDAVLFGERGTGRDPEPIAPLVRSNPGRSLGTGDRETATFLGTIAFALSRDIPTFVT